MRVPLLTRMTCRAPRRGALLLGGSLLAACVGKTQVPLALQSSFGPPPASSNPEPLVKAHGGIFWEATGFVIQEGNAVVLDPNNLKVIMARIGPQEWGSIAQARQP